MKERWWAIVGVDDEGEHKGRKQGRLVLSLASGKRES
jgi:hypothetical protein